MVEKVVIVGTILKSEKNLQKEYRSLEELSNLVSTANGVVEKSFIVKRDKIDPAYYIGKGKAEEIGEYVSKNKIKTVVFNNELTPAQIKNLEEKIDAKIIDRTRLILDIFAQRAHTKEAKLQVELAQLEYLLPRLTKKGIYMDNQVGGIGTRGPGETKLEYDRRKIMQRIEKIKEELKKVVIARQEQKKLRIESQIPIVTLIGYTNSGKSTLFNALLKQNHAYADDKLFATLDPLTRKLILPSGAEVIIVDTVGFIDKLPHTLIESFKSTLEIVKDASLLLEVIDVSSEEIEEKEKLVKTILDELGASNIPIIKVYNKIDLLENPKKNFIFKKLNKKNAVFISAKYAINLEALLEKIEKLLKLKNFVKTIKLPAQKYELLDFIYKHCKIISNIVKGDLLLLKILTNNATYNIIKNKLKSNI
ncbi:MAG: GTPase HflX [Endomicrobia bacterium]|nr:GTPase HflX [Endomicrobiia bacterium]